MSRNTTLSVTIMILAIALIAMQANFTFAVGSTVYPAACGTGMYTATLTGWDLNGATPKGEAEYDSSKDQLNVEVKNVKLKDGTILEILIGDDKIGKLEPLKDGTAKAMITLKDELDEKSRVRVLDDDRPIVSANLQCDASQPDKN